MSKVLSYRPDIDTLRAVAVLSVVVFHIGDFFVQKILHPPYQADIARIFYRIDGNADMRLSFIHQR